MTEASSARARAATRLSLAMLSATGVVTSAAIIWAGSSVPGVQAVAAADSTAQVLPQATQSAHHERVATRRSHEGRHEPKRKNPRAGRKAAHHHHHHATTGPASTTPGSPAAGAPTSTTSSTGSHPVSTPSHHSAHSAAPTTSHAPAPAPTKTAAPAPPVTPVTAPPASPPPTQATTGPSGG